MLELTVPDKEFYNEVTGEFFTKPGGPLVLEHSLLSISKWESKTKKPFLYTMAKSMKPDEFIEYVKCMTVNRPKPEVYENIDLDILDKVRAYMEDPMTATWFSEKDKRRSREIVTAEVVYYWMTALQIPFECEKWHFNRLMTLITVCKLKNQPPKKMSERDVMSRNSKLNAARRKASGSRG